MLVKIKVRIMFHSMANQYVSESKEDKPQNPAGGLAGLTKNISICTGLYINLQTYTFSLPEPESVLLPDSQADFAAPPPSLWPVAERTDY